MPLSTVDIPYGMTYFCPYHDLIVPNSTSGLLWNELR